jgi:hypothetical protein
MLWRLGKSLGDECGGLHTCTFVDEIRPIHNRDVTTEARSDNQGRRLRQGRGMVALAEIYRTLAMRRASQLRSMLWNFERLMALHSHAFCSLISKLPAIGRLRGYAFFQNQCYLEKRK